MIQQYLRLSCKRPDTAIRALTMGSLCPLLCACSSDVVNMGEDMSAAPVRPTPPAHSLCRERSTLDGDFIALSQTDIDALEGCQIISGDLWVPPFFDPDLRPLYALTAVGGELGFGVSYAGPTGAHDVAEIAFRERGFLESLEGLESLESVGSLLLQDASTQSLAPLENLRNVNGALTLDGCDEITDLTPLGNVSNIGELHVDADNLKSLAGLQFDAQMASLHIVGEKLVNIDALANVGIVYQDVYIAHTALRNLRGLNGLTSIAGTLAVSENPALETLDGLQALEYVGLPPLLGIGHGVSIDGNPVLETLDALNALILSGALTIERNDRLRRLPEFPSMNLDGLYVRANLALQELPDFPGILAWQVSNGVDDVVLNERLEPQQRLRYRPEIIIARNPALQGFAVPLGWYGGTYVNIEGNPQLREVDLSELESIDILEVKDNATLTDVSLGALAIVDTLDVSGNPMLPASSFEGVRTFESTLSQEEGTAP